MRATIKFEADVDKVKDIMRSLVLEETNTLSDAMDCMGAATSDRLFEEISEALGHLQSVTRQLEQYRGMLLSFEKARLETILPAPAGPIPRGEDEDGTADPIVRSGFDNFVERMVIPREEGDDAETEEG